MERCPSMFIIMRNSLNFLITWTCVSFYNRYYVPCCLFMLGMKLDINICIIINYTIIIFCYYYVILNKYIHKAYFCNSI